MIEKLYITAFGTIKGSYFKETNINKFFRKIEKNINKFSKYCKYNDMDMYICYNANVYKEDENLYRVSIIRSYDKEKYNYDNYSINTSDFPQYAKVLDKYAEITAKNEYERECYKKLERNEIGTTEENVGYLKYLKKLGKCTSRNFFNKVLSILASPLSLLMLTASIHFTLPFAAGIFAFESVRHMAKLPKALIGDFSSQDGAYYTYTDSVADALRSTQFVGKRIRQVSKRLGVREDIQVDNNIINVNKDDMYRDGVINYMNSIMTAANGLNSDDRKRVLYDLKEILDEYTAKCCDANNDDGLGLSLDGGKRQVVKETVEKLAVLQMELADLIKRDNKNKTLLMENEKFRQAINDSIEGAEEGKKLTLARGR